jgi:hypothetical protein
MSGRALCYLRAGERWTMKRSLDRERVSGTQRPPWCHVAQASYANRAQETYKQELSLRASSTPDAMPQCASGKHRPPPPLTVPDCILAKRLASLGGSCSVSQAKVPCRPRSARSRLLTPRRSTAITSPSPSMPPNSSPCDAPIKSATADGSPWTPHRSNRPPSRRKQVSHQPRPALPERSQLRWQSAPAYRSPIHVAQGRQRDVHIPVANPGLNTWESECGENLAMFFWRVGVPAVPKSPDAYGIA